MGSITRLPPEFPLESLAPARFPQREGEQTRFAIFRSEKLRRVGGRIIL